MNIGIGMGIPDSVLGNGHSFPTTRNFVSEGDSITAAANSYAIVAASVAAPTIATYTNKAVSGNTIADLIGRAAVVDALKVTGAANILSVFIGANDTPDNTWLATVAGYLDARRAAGWYVILCTLLPHNSAPWLAARATANPELRLWTSTGSIVPGKHADRICDFGADPVMGADGQQANATYYNSGDQLHPTITALVTPSGQSRMLHMFQPVLDASMSNVATSPTIASIDYTTETGASDTLIDLRADRGVYWSVSGDANVTLTELFQLNLVSAAAPGVYSTTVTATDANGRISNKTINWTVVDPPTNWGPNLIKNGDFSNGTNFWTSVDAATTSVVSDGSGGFELSITGNGGGFPQCTQAVTIISGKTYKFDAVCRKLASNPANANAAWQSGGSNIGTANTTNTPITNTFVAGSTSTSIIPFILSAAATGTARFDQARLRQQLP